jgi:nitroreductase
MSSPISFLTTRRSVSARFLGPPGPDPEQLRQILTAGLRVPDHGKLAPWRFVLLEGEHRRRAGEGLLAIRLDRGDVLAEEERRAEVERFTSAPIAVGIVSRAAPHPKIPEWEQRLSAGAVCMNVLNGAHALGFAAQLLTDWPVYDAGARRFLGLEPWERLCGFIHIGTAKVAPAERPRPEPDAITTRWEPPEAGR